MKKIENKMEIFYGNDEVTVVFPGGKKYFKNQIWFVFTDLDLLKESFFEHCEVLQYSENEILELRKKVSETLSGKLDCTELILPASYIKSSEFQEDIKMYKETINVFCQENRRLTESETISFRELIAELFLGKYNFCNCNLYAYSKSKQYFVGDGAYVE